MLKYRIYTSRYNIQSLTLNYTMNKWKETYLVVFLLEAAAQ
jgi:hypothetical protein